MTFPDVRSVIPQSRRMALLDRIVASSADSLTAEVTVREDSLFFEGSGVGAWVGIEYMAQAAAAFAGMMDRVKTDVARGGLLAGVRRYECSRPEFPLGCTLQVTVRRDPHSDERLSLFDCAIDGDGIAARGTLSIAHGVLTAGTSREREG